MVDCCFSAEEAKRRKILNYRDRTRLLTACGVKPEDVSMVVMTHLHYDHWSGHDLFPNATYVIQEREIEFWRGPGRATPMFAASADLDAIDAVGTLLQAGRIRTVCGDWMLHEGIDVRLVGGHTPERLGAIGLIKFHCCPVRTVWRYYRQGINRDTVFPSPLVTINRDPISGEPNGVFVENTRKPILEFTAMAAAPNFTPEQRVEALALSMATYNSVGTTSVFEGHGVSADVIAAYQGLRNAGRQTMRAHLVLSPSWGGMGTDDIRAMLGSWAQWVGRRGLGDEWLRVADIYTEIDRSAESRMRVRRPVQTGWAGYSPDAGLEREAILELMIEAARNDIRVSGIWGNLLPLFAEVDKRISLAGRRWVLGHQQHAG